VFTLSSAEIEKERICSSLSMIDAIGKMWDEVFSWLYTRIMWRIMFLLPLYTLLIMGSWFPCVPILIKLSCNLAKDQVQIYKW
jgi:hypothetical protein